MKHFIAMMGFAIPGQTSRYNVVLTIVSMLIAVLVVGIGTFIVGFSQAQPGRSQPGRDEPGSLFRPQRPKIQP